MATTNKKSKAPSSPNCPGCKLPTKFVFKIEGSFELSPYWNADSAEQILTQALDKGLEQLAQGYLSKRVEYVAHVFEDKEPDGLND